MKIESVHLASRFGHQTPRNLRRRLEQLDQQIEREIERLELGYQPEPREMQDAHNHS